MEGGRQTQCAVTCIGKIRLQGFIHAPDRVDPDNPLDYLVCVTRVALPLYPRVGLAPNTYYMPPAVKELTVRALHNGGWITFLMAWKDPALSAALLGAWVEAEIAALGAARTRVVGPAPVDRVAGAEAFTCPMAALPEPPTGPAGA